jgi:hypothetical protein
MIHMIDYRIYIHQGNDNSLIYYIHKPELRIALVVHLTYMHKHLVLLSKKVSNIDIYLISHEMVLYMDNYYLLLYGDYHSYITNNHIDHIYILLDMLHIITHCLYRMLKD